MTDPTKSAEYERNTKEQYEALGRFIEAFEAMVNEVRLVCIKLIPHSHENEHLLRIPFYNQSMTARPLFQVMRAIIAEIIVALENGGKITQAKRNTFLGVLTALDSEYVDLAETRNGLLHGTWFIGYSGGDDPYCKEFIVHTFKTGKTGLALVELLRTAKELSDLTKRCENARNAIGILEACLIFSEQGLDIDKNFKTVDKRWVRVTNAGDIPLQQKPDQARS